MITTVSTTAQLTVALKAAHNGDTIQLAAGTYSGIKLSDVNFTQGVTVTSRDPGAPAVITDLKVSGSSGLTFQDLEFRVDKNAGPRFDIADSKNLHFVRLDVHGTMDDDPTKDGQAFIIRDSSNVSIEDSEFQQLWTGISHEGSDHLVISGNDFHDIRADGVRGGGSSFITIINNSFHDFHRLTTDHADAIQFWTRDTGAVAHDFYIANNSFVRGSGDDIQGVFLGDEDGIPYEHITITGNLVAGGAINGITVSHGRDITVTDNIVQGFLDKKSYIRVDEVDGAVVTGNISNMINITAQATHVTASNNTVVPLAADLGAWAIQQWEAVHGESTGLGRTLAGGAGADTLTGGDLADTLSGGGGVDVLTGGGGDDVYVVAIGKPTIVETTDGGTDTLRTSASYTLAAHIENLELTGTKAVNGMGNNQDNVITGNGAANFLRGRDGADTLSGGDGADTIDGGAGGDALRGGEGADRFVFVRGDGDDIIRDFGLGGEHDVLDLSDFLGAGLRPTITDAAGGLTISFTTGDSLFLKGVHPGGLHATPDGYIF